MGVYNDTLLARRRVPPDAQNASPRHWWELHMSLLYDIQSAVLNEGADLGPILLKVRLLAARLGSQPLADWVKHESEGYPLEAVVPDYRVIPVTYTGTFSGSFGSGINNAPIPSLLIEKLAGKQWTHYEMRQSVAAVDQLLATSAKGQG
jgi:AbiTii-like protein